MQPQPRTVPVRAPPVRHRPRAARMTCCPSSSRSPARPSGASPWGGRSRGCGAASSSLIPSRSPSRAEHPSGVPEAASPRRTAGTTASTSAGGATGCAPKAVSGCRSHVHPVGSLRPSQPFVRVRMRSGRMPTETLMGIHGHTGLAHRGSSVLSYIREIQAKGFLLAGSSRCPPP